MPRRAEDIARARSQAIVDWLEMTFGRDTVPAGLMPPEDEPPLAMGASVLEAEQR